MSSELRRALLWIVSIVCITGGVFGENWFGIPITTIMVVAGCTALFRYVFEKGLSQGSPKYVAARREIAYSLWIMTVGAGIISAAIVQGILARSEPASYPGLALGGATFLASIAAFTIALKRAKPNNSQFLI